MWIVGILLPRFLQQRRIASRTEGREEAGGIAPILREIRLDLRRGQLGRRLSFAELEESVSVAELEEPRD